LVIAAPAVLSHSAFAQDGASVMIRADDSGGRQVTRLSMPDFATLSTPDFTRKDLPIFIDQLLLSDPQREIIGRMIDAYLAEFRELTRQLASTAGPQAEYVPEDDGRPDERRPRGRVMLGGSGGALPPMDFEGLEEQLPPGSSMAISVGVEDSGPGPEGAVPSPPRADVSVSIDAPDGEDIPQDLIDKIQAKADEMAAKITEAMAQQREAGEAGGAAEADQERPADMIVGNMEDVQARHAELLAKIEEFRKARAQLRAKFVIDAQATLAEEQAARWPALERALTRERSLPKGRLAGESTDLTKVLDSLKIDQGRLESIAPALEAYEMALDAALKARDAFLVHANCDIDVAIAEQKPDRAIQIAERVADLRVAVRSVNQNNALQIAQALGGDDGLAFDLAALKTFYPKLYQTTRGQKMFAAAESIDGLDVAQQAAIDDLSKAYESELANLNQQIRGVIDREQPLESVRSLQRLQRTMEGTDQAPDPHGDPDQGFAEARTQDPVRQAMARRGELDDKYLNLASKVLTAAQASGLPKPRTNKGPIVIRSGGGNG
jgi:hypothetical protein